MGDREKERRAEARERWGGGGERESIHYARLITVLGAVITDHAVTPPPPLILKRLYLTFFPFPIGIFPPSYA